MVCSSVQQTTPVRQSLKMRYIAGYLLAVLGGNENPSTADVSAILSAAGVEVDQELLNLVHKQVAGQSLDELIATGNDHPFPASPYRTFLRISI